MAAEAPRQAGKARQGPTPSANVKAVPREPSSAETTFGTFQAQYKVLDQPLGTSRALKVIFLGGGASGINFAYQVRKFLPAIKFSGYEANPEMGGTWFENRYPGCGCDVPSHTYQYAWAPNPDWSAYYVGHKEIKEYFQKVIQDHDLAKYFKLNHRVIRAVWNEKTSQWYITIRINDDPATDFEDSCDYFINGSGILNAWKYPDVPGLHSFKGPLVHSANWPKDLDLKGKRVGLIGVGSTATQIIPAIQPEVAHLTAFVRSKTWITPPFGAQHAGPNGENVFYTAEERKKWVEDRDEYNRFRKSIESEFNKRFRFLYKGSDEQKEIFDFFTKWMAEKLPGRPDLQDMLIPDFAVGCRRITPGGGFLEALMEPNVSLTKSAVVSVNETGITTADGKHHEIDVLICATGFDLSFKPRFELIGRNGIDLRDQWNPRPSAYLSTAVSNMPNYSMIMGPGAPLAQGSMIPSTERICEYILQVLFRMSTEPILSIEIKPECERELWAHYQEQIKGMVWTSHCSSSFKNGNINAPIDSLHPGSRMHYFALLSWVRWEDYNYTHTNNRYAHLGNGLTTRETEGRDLSYYLLDDMLKLPEY